MRGIKIVSLAIAFLMFVSFSAAFADWDNDIVKVITDKTVYKVDEPITVMVEYTNTGGTKLLNYPAPGGLHMTAYFIPAGNSLGIVGVNLAIIAAVLQNAVTVDLSFVNTGVAGGYVGPHSSAIVGMKTFTPGGGNFLTAKILEPGVYQVMVAFTVKQGTLTLLATRPSTIIKIEE